MAEAVTTAKLVGAGDVDWALGHAAVHAHFAEADLGSILDHHAHAQPGPVGHAGPVLVTVTGQVSRPLLGSSYWPLTYGKAKQSGWFGHTKVGCCPVLLWGSRRWSPPSPHRSRHR